MESSLSTKFQIPPFYISGGNEFSALNKAQFDIAVPSSIYFKITPKYLIICTAKVITYNDTYKYLVDNEHIEFHTFFAQVIKTVRCIHQVP
jgi:ketopantoate reductase